MRKLCLDELRNKPENTVMARVRYSCQRTYSVDAPDFGPVEVDVVELLLKEKMEVFPPAQAPLIKSSGRSLCLETFVSGIEGRFQSVVSWDLSSNRHLVEAPFVGNYILPLN